LLLQAPGCDTELFLLQYLSDSRKEALPY